MMLLLKLWLPINLNSILLEYSSQVIYSIVEGSHLSRVLLPLLTTQFDSIFLGCIQILVRLDQLIYLLRGLIQSLILLGFLVHLFLLLDCHFEFFDGLFEPHHVCMSAFIESIAFCKLLF